MGERVLALQSIRDVGERCYRTILFLGSNGGGKSVSPSISRRSISVVRHICEIGTSFALPSNGLSVLSPTRPSDVYIQEINTLKGMTSPLHVDELRHDNHLAGEKSLYRFALKSQDLGRLAACGKDPHQLRIREEVRQFRFQ